MVVVLGAVLLVATLAFPSVRVVDVLASLGIVSVAVGFPFKDVLENLLAGVLLLLRDSFRSGDQIRVGDHEGTVEGVTVRETLLRTFDGELVLIPNAQVYTSPLTVGTHYPFVRVSFRLDLTPDSDLGAITTAALPVLQSACEPDAPAADVIAVGAKSGALQVEFRLWTASPRAARTAALHRVVPRTLAALTRAGVQLDEQRLVLVEPPPE